MHSSPRWIQKYELKPDLWIFNPTKESIAQGKEIKDAVQERWTLPSNYFHLLPGGHLAALNVHKADKFFVHLDIAKFFNSINRSRVTRSLKELFDYETSRKYTLISTVKHPAKSPAVYMLPYGFVQSPILASLCLRYSTLGRKIDNLSRATSIQVSVYMDDIIISGNDSDHLGKIAEEVKESADRSGFTLNTAKEEGPSATITVFNIKLTNASLEIKPTRYEEFKDRYNSTKNPRIKRGIETYITSVNTSQLAGL